RLARREIDEVVAGVRARADALVEQARATGFSTGQAGAIRAEALAEIARVVEQTRGDDLAAPERAGERALVEDVPTGMLAVGARVVVPGFGMEGTVVALHGSHAEVEVRGKRLKAKARELRVVATPPAQTPAVRVNVSLQPREGLLSELNVIGCTVDEAIDR